MKMVLLVVILMGGFTQANPRTVVEQQSQSKARLMTSNETQISRGGSEGTGGGDECENRIQEIRDDISSWISKGRPKEFRNISVSHEEYSARMMEYLATVKQPNGAITPVTKIECVRHTIEVQGFEKTCRFDNYGNSPKITCNADTFMDSNMMNVDAQYRLIHHEYAGLANLEVPSKSQSSYEFSNQIVAFLENQVVKKLAVKKKSDRKITPDGMVEYDHVVDQKYGYYDVYLPKLKSSDGSYYVLSQPENEVQLDNSADVSFPRISDFSKTDAICASFGLSRNRNHVSTWGAVDANEKFVIGLYESPQALKKSWWSQDKASKLVVLHCENRHDPSRNNGVFTGAPVIRVIGGTIIISYP